MYKILSSLLKYVLWLAAVLLLLTYTEDYTLLEKCGMICAAVILIDAVFLIVEVIRNAVRSTKRAGARMKQRANKRRIARAEKHAAENPFLLVHRFTLSGWLAWIRSTNIPETRRLSIAGGVAKRGARCYIPCVCHPGGRSC